MHCERCGASESERWGAARQHIRLCVACCTLLQPKPIYAGPMGQARGCRLCRWRAKPGAIPGVTVSHLTDGQPVCVTCAGAGPRGVDMLSGRLMMMFRHVLKCHGGSWGPRQPHRAVWWDTIEQYVDANHPGVTNSGCVLWWDEWWGRLCGLLGRMGLPYNGDVLHALPTCTTPTTTMEDINGEETRDTALESTTAPTTPPARSAGLIDEHFMELANDDTMDFDDDAEVDEGTAAQPTLFQLWRTSRVPQRWRRARPTRPTRATRWALTPRVSPVGSPMSPTHLPEEQQRQEEASTSTGRRRRRAHVPHDGVRDATQQQRGLEPEPTTDGWVLTPAEAEWAMDPGG